MSHYERDDCLSRAAVIICERIKSRPEYRQARDTVLSAAIGECRGRDVAGMRALGGFSAVLLRHIDALPSEYRANIGSPLLPRSVVDVLRGDVSAMREELQSTLAAGSGDTESEAIEAARETVRAWESEARR